jgi:RNA polymerase sigma-70 factor (ECF subfamily)
MADEREHESDELGRLMASAQGGDSRAYELLLKHLVPIVRAAVRRNWSFSSRHDLDDVVQDVLVSLHSVRATYDPERPFLPWLFAIVRNRAVDHGRRAMRRSAREVGVEGYPETFSAEETNTNTDTYGDEEALRAAIAGLPAAQRIAIEHLKIKEMSLKEASQATGMSIGALKVAVHRAIKSLRAALGRQE